MQPLVSTDWLALRLGLPNLIVVDASVVKLATPEGDYVRRAAWLEFEASGHIPGARYADLVHDFSDPGAEFTFTRPGARQMEAAAGALGLSAKSQIVVYDSTNGIWAARLWWLLRAYGHRDVAVLDGGLKKWVAEHRPISFGSAPVTAAPFRAHLQDGFFVDKADVIEVGEGRGPATLICVLRPQVFSGEEKPYSRAGHIPGSANFPHTDLVDSGTNALHPPAVLRTRLEPLLNCTGQIILYCGGGITAAGSALALTILGASNVAIYDGSLAEWSADASLAMEVDFA